MNKAEKIEQGPFVFYCFTVRHFSTSGMTEAANSNLFLLYFCKLRILLPLDVLNLTAEPVSTTTTGQ